MSCGEGLACWGGDVWEASEWGLCGEGLLEGLWRWQGVVLGFGGCEGVRRGEGDCGGCLIVEDGIVGSVVGEGCGEEVCLGGDWWLGSYWRLWGRDLGFRLHGGMGWWKGFGLRGLYGICGIIGGLGGEGS